MFIIKFVQDTAIDWHRVVVDSLTILYSIQTIKRLCDRGISCVEARSKTREVYLTCVDDPGGKISVYFK